MGFPEILFNFFPGMGAYSFLMRKVGRQFQTNFLTIIRCTSTTNSMTSEIINVITPDGTGEAAVSGYVRKHSKAGNSQHAG